MGSAVHPVQFISPDYFLDFYPAAQPGPVNARSDMLSGCATTLAALNIEPR
jgi:hypothetical protein